MIIKSFEISKINLEKFNLFLLYGENEGLKNEVLNTFSIKLKNYKKIRYDENEILENYEKFISEIWRWKEESGNTITEQLRRLGASVDWAREAFTMNEDLSLAVREVFVSLFEEGLIYRGERLVNWDVVLQTALSDLEVTSEEETGS